MLEIQGYKELYEQERLKVYNMDCMDLLKQVPDKYFDLAIVDPPYGIGDRLEKGGGKLRNTPMAKLYRKSSKWDNKTPDSQYFNELFRVSRNQIIWGGNYFNLPPTRCIISWDKLQYMHTLSQFELAWTSFDKVSKIFKKTSTDLERFHPTQKPVALYTWLLEKYAKPNFKIIDTHFGSGSHAIANHYYGSELIACELDTDYFKASIERIKKETRQLSFLQGGD